MDYKTGAIACYNYCYGESVSYCFSNALYFIRDFIHLVGGSLYLLLPPFWPRSSPRSHGYQ